jgi:hypothetical protein
LKSGRPVAEKVLGSLEFAGQLANGSEWPPQAYCSEGQLDTLGV